MERYAALLKKGMVIGFAGATLASLLSQPPLREVLQAERFRVTNGEYFGSGTHSLVRGKLQESSLTLYPAHEQESMRRIDAHIIHAPQDSYVTYMRVKFSDGICYSPAPMIPSSFERSCTGGEVASVEAIVHRAMRHQIE